MAGVLARSVGVDATCVPGLRLAWLRAIPRRFASRKVCAGGKAGKTVHASSTAACQRDRTIPGTTKASRPARSLLAYGAAYHTPCCGWSERFRLPPSCGGDTLARSATSGYQYHGSAPGPYRSGSFPHLRHERSVDSFNVRPVIA